MKGPVFIIGCPRSGTSFLYHLMLSAGGFAEFRTQMNVYDVLEPIYGDLRVLANKRRMMKDWLRSKAFAVSGLDADEIKEKVLAECRNGSDFLRLVMDSVASRQGVNRWIDSTPTNAPHISRIHRDFPEAKFVHIIRDPRDVALSLDKRGWTRPLPWDKENSLPAAGVYWKWIVSKARNDGKVLGDAYTEIRYEDLAQNPKQSLARLGEFLDHDLDYDRIQQVSIGSVRKPLTSFAEDLESGNFKPVGRWQERFPAHKLTLFEALIGDYMCELGYRPSKPISTSHFRTTVTRLTYGTFYELKQWAKTNTPLSRWRVNYSEILIDK
jgi:hypothetical protein